MQFLDRARTLSRVLYLGIAASLLTAPAFGGADWPQFLGPSRDGIYAGADLASSWPKEGPAVQWQKAVGQGFSGPVVAHGKLVLFHRLADKERVDCFDASSGKDLWHFEYPTAYKDDFGFDEGPRATPVISSNRVFTFGAEGVLTCLDLAGGTKNWSADTKSQFKADKGFFGVACSPLVLGNKVLLNIGGAQGAGIVAFGSSDGKVFWKSTDDEASYSSPVAALLNGKIRALVLTRSGLVSLDPENGKVQFSFPWRARSHASVNAATPLVIGDLVFVSASYETGAALLRVRGTTPEKVWSSDESLSNHYATSVHRDGCLYGFHGRQENGPSLRCVELKSGKVLWSQDRFGAGTLVLANDKLVVMKEDGQLLLVAASSQGYRELARAQVLPKTVRAYPALANGCLYARSKDKLVCLDLRTSR